MDIQNFLNHFKGVQAGSTSGQWKAICPAHDDHKPSLSITDKGNLILAHCQVGCSVESVLVAAGLKMSDLFNESQTVKPHVVKETEHRYTNETGEYAFSVYRKDMSDGTKIITQTKGKHEVKHYPFRLPELLHSLKESPDTPIMIHEGEKCCNIAREKYGQIATTNSGGARKWTPKHSQFLTGANVVIFPDNDTEGVNHKHIVAQSLQGIAKTIRVVTLPGLPKKGGIDDWKGTKEELDRLIASAPEYVEETVKVDPTAFAFTDSGNAEFFQHNHGNEFLFNHSRSKWMHWDLTRWQIDEKGYVDQCMKDSARKIPAYLDVEEPDSQYKKMVRHALTSESKKGIFDALALAKSLPHFARLASEFNTDHWLFNCANGTLNLKTGEFYYHCREDYLTKISQVKYVAGAECPLWYEFLETIFAKDQALIAFVQRLVGLFLTGDISPQILIFFYGTGANGKSVLVNVLEKLLGDYFLRAPTSMLMQDRKGAIPNDIAMLPGARLCACNETGENKKLDEEIVKNLTGGESISACFKFQEHFDFDPTHKLLIVGNHKPRIQGTDTGIWRRVCLVPFLITIPPEQRIPMNLLLERFDNELSGILNWAIAGYQSYVADGLQIPGCVTAATKEYRQTEDVIADFLSDCCEEDPAYLVKFSNLFSTYTAWCLNSGERPKSKKMLSVSLKDRKYQECRNMNARQWSGLRLRANSMTDMTDNTLKPDSTLREKNIPNNKCIGGDPFLPLDLSYLSYSDKPIHQVDTQCPECGSFYRRGNFCNVCRSIQPIELCSAA